jgi:hypothetical protein
MGKIVKELTKNQKIKLIELVLANPVVDGLCARIAKAAFDLGYITKHDYETIPCFMLPAELIPELDQIKPDGVGFIQHWFGGPAEENIPPRQYALKRLLGIVKSKPTNH